MVTAVLGVLFGLLLAVPSAAQSETLTTDQEALADRIEGKLMGACCWTATVADAHDSDVVLSEKAEIRSLLAQGRSEQQVLDSFVQKYGEKILAKPTAKGFNWLAYLLPPLAVIAAGTVLLLAVGRWRRPATAGVIDESGGVTPQESELARRVQDELDRFDT